MPSPTRKIGDTDVSAIGWGAMGISTFYGSTDQTVEDRLKVLDHAFELGITHWDSADIYADSEDLIGKWFSRSGKRSAIFLATKFGYQRDMSFRGDSTYVRSAFETSAHRLGVNYIDLYYAHRVDPNVPIEETVGAMAELVKEGKIKYIGLSEPSSAALRRAHAVHPIAAVQVEYSPFTLDIENPNPQGGLLSTARELGVTVVAYSPLGRGILAGKFNSRDNIAQDDSRLNMPRFSNEGFPKMLAVLNEIKAVAERHRATPSQISLAWLLAQGDDIIPIPGTRTIKYLEQNAEAVNVKLTPEECDIIRKAALASGIAEVPRYTEFHMVMTNVDSPLPKIA